LQPTIVIWGASGHARVVADIIRLGRHYQIAGFLDDIRPDLSSTPFCGATILGGREQLDRLRERGISQLVFGIGDGQARLRLAELAQQRGFTFVSAIHPRATIAQDVQIGPGTVVAAGAVINPAAVIGAHVIVNTCASVDHECVVADGAHICPGARLAGNVAIGRAAWVGIGATVIQRTRIGAGALIGAGAVVTRDIPDGATAYGVPARLVKEHQEL